MAFLTFGDIKRFSATVSEERILKSAAETVAGKRVFLSYSSRDLEYVPGVIRFLEGFNASVYIDAGDKSLPQIPSPETAERLRSVIRNCPRFMVLVSPSSHASRWIPWELGLADGYKGASPVALLPIAPTSMEEAWAKQEYLGLYPRVVLGDSWSVYDPRDKKAWPLSSWLHNAV